MHSFLLDTRLWNRTKITRLVDRVTARVQNAVRRRVVQQLPQMNVHEARGYIRARAASVVRREMGIVVTEEKTLSPAERQLIVGAVKRRVVRRLLLENLRRIEPTSVTGRRAA